MNDDLGSVKPKAMRDLLRRARRAGALVELTDHHVRVRPPNGGRFEVFSRTGSTHKNYYKLRSALRRMNLLDDLKRASPRRAKRE